MRPSLKVIRVSTEPRRTCNVPVFWPEASHCRMSGSGMVRRLPVRLMAGGPPLGDGASALVPVYVPEEIVPPTLRSAVDAEAQGQGRKRLGPARPPDEAEAALLRRSIPLPAIAGNTARHDVVPALVPAPRHRDDVVKGELTGRKTVAAILARMVVPGVHVGPGEGYVREGTFHSDVTEQAQHRGELHPYRYAADLPVVDGDDFDLALEQERDGFLPGDDPQRLVGRIEDKCLLHSRKAEKIVRLGP